MKNVAASIHARLLKVAKTNGEDFNYTLIRYGFEGLLARWAASKHRDSFVMKGAMLFRVWSAKTHRPTKDLDLLGSGAPDLERLTSMLGDICALTIDDGLVCDTAIEGEPIKENDDYEGVRLHVNGKLGRANRELR